MPQSQPRIEPCNRLVYFVTHYTSVYIIYRYKSFWRAYKIKMIIGQPQTVFMSVKNKMSTTLGVSTNFDNTILYYKLLYWSIRLLSLGSRNRFFETNSTFKVKKTISISYLFFFFIVVYKRYFFTYIIL